MILLLLGLLVTACGAQQAVAPAATSVPAAPAATTAPAATAMPAATAAPTSGAITKENPPAVANPAAAQQYKGVTITYYGDSVGLGAELDDILAKRFTQGTGVNIKVIRKPQDSTENYATYQRFFQAQSPDIDVMMLDVIWPGALAQHLVDLGPKLGDAAKAHFAGIVQNDTVNGKLVAMPWFGDFGMLYYRTDLLKKYGYSKPPETWDELEQMAKKIQDGERASNPDFTGFVWQGAAYEGLTCDALEWVYSQGGGAIIENGKVTINNQNAVNALNRAKGWIGTISPQGVTSYKEEDARNIFQGGNAAFMRNWPYAYAAGNQPDSPIKGKFDVAPLPHDPGQQSAGTVGGWQLGVSKYSRYPDAAIEFVRYMTSPEVETYRAVVGSYVPTITSVSADPRVLQAMPFLKNLADVVRVTRPSRELGANYNQGSTVFFQGVYRVLQGQDAAQILPQVAQQLQRLLQ
jgi:trehalose/maltose transport system substrate-binding protein